MIRPKLNWFKPDRTNNYRLSNLEIIQWGCHHLYDAFIAICSLGYCRSFSTVKFSQSLLKRHIMRLKEEGK